MTCRPLLRGSETDACLFAPMTLDGEPDFASLLRSQALGGSVRQMHHHRLAIAGQRAELQRRALARAVHLQVQVQWAERRSDTIQAGDHSRAEPLRRQALEQMQLI